MTLWGLSMNGPISAAPQIEPVAGADDGSVCVTWIWKTQTWNLRIDPAAETAMVEEPCSEGGATTGRE